MHNCISTGRKRAPSNLRSAVKFLAELVGPLQMRGAFELFLLASCRLIVKTHIPLKTNSNQSPRKLFDFRPRLSFPPRASEMGTKLTHWEPNTDSVHKLFYIKLISHMRLSVVPPTTVEEEARGIPATDMPFCTEAVKCVPGITSFKGKHNSFPHRFLPTTCTPTTQQKSK